MWTTSMTDLDPIYYLILFNQLQTLFARKDKNLSRTSDLLLKSDHTYRGHTILRDVLKVGMKFMFALRPITSYYVT